MAEDGEERRFFGGIARNQAKYGSTTKPGHQFSKYVKHTVSSTDTLMGLALKYGTTAELIKRVNKIWTNDSLFLAKTLHIPITQDNSHMVQDEWELINADEVRTKSNSDSLTDSGEPNCELGDTRSGVKANGAVTDFFSKYDSSIADLKNKVDSLEKSSSHRDDPNLSSLIPRRHSETTRTSRSQPRTISLETPDSPVLIIRSNTQNYRVQTAVKRSEQANDDLYQL